MKIKALTTFVLADGRVINKDREVDVPRDVGIYLVGATAAIELDGGIGEFENRKVEVPIVDAEDKATTAIATLQAPIKTDKKTTKKSTN